MACKQQLHKLEYAVLKSLTWKYHRRWYWTIQNNISDMFEHDEDHCAYVRCLDTWCKKKMLIAIANIAWSAIGLLSSHRSSWVKEAHWATILLLFYSISIKTHTMYQISRQGGGEMQLNMNFCREVSIKTLRVIMTSLQILENTLIVVII